MPTKDVYVIRTGADDPSATLKAYVEAQFMAAMEKKAALQLGEVPAGPPFQWEWDVFGFGPWQAPAMPPGRIIAVGETAYIATVVYMNHLMCSTLAGFGGYILLNYWTANTQMIMPVPALARQVCVEPGSPGVFGCFSVDIFPITPTEEAWILETNICARLCNVQNRVVPGYTTFVRWVRSFDPEVLWPTTPTIEFDIPVRYTVYDPNAECTSLPTI
jgi:hypothetical protein